MGEEEFKPNMSKYKKGVRIQTIKDKICDVIISNRVGVEPIYKPNSDKIAEHIKSKYTFINIRETDILYYYKEGIYINALNLVKEECKKLSERIGNQINTYIVNETTNHIKWTKGIDQEILKTFDKYLCLQNGILSTENYDFEEHTPTKIFLDKLPVNYDPKEKSKEFLKFINSSLEGQEEDIELIKQFFGSCLVRHYLTQKALILVGEQGTGKSTLVESLVKMLGEDNISSVSIQHLGSRFKTSLLKRKLANIYDDLSDKGLYDTSLFKQATGGSPLQTEVKHKQEPEKFNNYAKLIYTANVIPSTPDDTDAFFVRVEIVKFNKVFRGTKNENKNLSKILQSETGKTELLNWLLEGLKELKANKWSFKKRYTMEEVRRIYKINSNPLTAFIEEMCEISEDNEIHVNYFYNNYKLYCEANGQKPLHQNYLGKEISRLKLPIFRVRRYLKDLETGLTGEREYRYTGIKLIKDNPSNPNKSFMHSKILENIVIGSTIENVRDTRVINFDTINDFIVNNYKNYGVNDLITLALNEFEDINKKQLKELLYSLVERGGLPNTYMDGV